MANRITTPTIHTINASKNFGTWLTEKMKETHTTDDKLADYVDMDRKTILRYRHNEGTPRLDLVAKIFAYFGESSIHISLSDHQEDA